MQDNSIHSNVPNSEYFSYPSNAPPISLTSYPNLNPYGQAYSFFPFISNNYQNHPWFFDKTPLENQSYQNQKQYTKVTQFKTSEQRASLNQNMMPNETQSFNKQKQKFSIQTKNNSETLIKLQLNAQEEEGRSQKKQIIQNKEFINKFNKDQFNKADSYDKYQLSDFENQQDPEFAEIFQQLIIFVLNNYNQSDQFLRKFKNKFVNDTMSVWKASFGPLHCNKIHYLFKILTRKFQSFRKTKQEMIKYIFRRTYNIKNKPSFLSENLYKSSLNIHNKNLQDFKSMNTRFIEKQFENPYFYFLFKNFMDNFDQNFQQENNERIKRLRKIILEDYKKGNFNSVQNEKKLPWTKQYKEKVQIICNQYKNNYEKGKFIQNEQGQIEYKKCQIQQKEKKVTRRRKY